MPKDPASTSTTPLLVFCFTSARVLPRNRNEIGKHQSLRPIKGIPRGPFQSKQISPERGRKIHLNFQFEW